MSQQIELADILRRAFNANMQYYMTLSELAADCLQALIGSDKNPASTHTANSNSDTGAHDIFNANNPRSSEAPVTTIVLESEAGGLALGAFLIENALSAPVDAPIEVSEFVGPDGAEIRPLIKFEPDAVRLESKEQVLVRVVARIDKALDPGVRYRGVIHVPGLPGTQVPLVLRRRESDEAVEPVVSKEHLAKSKHKGRRSSSGQRSRKTH